MGWIAEMLVPRRRRARQWLRRANLARDMRNWPAAREAYGMALQEHPPAAPIWVQYGHAAKESGDVAAAEAAYRRALELQPGIADTHLQLGHALKLQDRLEPAVAAYASAVELAPDAAEHHLQFGHALKLAGRLEAAAAAYGRAAELAPAVADHQIQLGDALAALHRTAEALAAFDRALALRPGQAALEARRDALLKAQPAAVATGVSRDAVVWALRLFAGREPSSPQEIEFHQGHAGLESLRRAFAGTTEFTSFYRQLVRPTFAAPVFLLAPPQQAQIPWCFTPPGFARLGSQLCTAGQLEDPAYAAWCRKLGLAPTQHRKPWEFCFVAAALEADGLLRPGGRGLGFGCGQEPLPSYFAQRGVAVLATDAPFEVVAEQGWHTTGQYVAGLELVHRPELVAEAEFRRLVDFRAIDMNRIPADLTGFDFCWSACALEHLGSLRAGMDFIIASLATLRPGGLAVHTTEFNLTSNEATMETPWLSIYRRQDLETLMAELVAAGHEVAPFNTHPGDRELDAHIDLPPYALPHLKVQVESQVTTSFGLIIRKRRS